MLVNNADLGALYNVETIIGKKKHSSIKILKPSINIKTYKNSSIDIGTIKELYLSNFLKINGSDIIERLINPNVIRDTKCFPL